jgi:hypothetical protein
MRDTRAGSERRADACTFRLPIMGHASAERWISCGFTIEKHARDI